MIPTFDNDATLSLKLKHYMGLKQWGGNIPLAKGGGTWGVASGYIYLLKLRGEIVYVGQTINPPSRMQAHNRDKEFDQMQLLHVYACKMNIVEGILIVKHLPIYNRAIHSPVLGIGFNRDHLVSPAQYTTRKHSQRYSSGAYPAMRTA